MAVQSPVATSLAHNLEKSFYAFKAVADCLIGQVLAGLLAISQGKNKIPFYRKEVINKSTRVIFGLVQLVLL